MNAREKILEAADELFGELGFDAATTREIAERSGVNKALIHYHFQSKEELLEAVLDRYYERLREVVEKALEKPGDARQRLARLVDAYVDFLSRNRNFSRIVQRESSGGPRQKRIQGHLEPMFKLAVDMLHHEFPATRKGTTEAHQLLVSFYGVIVTYFTYSEILGGLIDKDPLSPRELAKRKRHLHWMLDVVLDAVEDKEACGRSKGGGRRQKAKERRGKGA